MTVFFLACGLVVGYPIGMLLAFRFLDWNDQRKLKRYFEEHS